MKDQEKIFNKFGKLKKGYFWEQNKYTVLSFLVPFLCMTIGFAALGVFPFGNSQVLVVDFWHQYFPFFNEFHEKILGGGSLLYSWNIGMGTNYLALMAYYTASPFYYLSIIIPKEFLTEFLAFSIAFKIGLSGGFFAVFLKGMYKRSNYATIIFSLMYALCSYSMGYYWCLMWLDCVLLLPLILLGLNKLIDEGKYKLYVISLAIALISNYYVAALICIFIVFYYITAYLIRYSISDWRTLLRKTGLVLGFSVLGVAIAGIILIPTYKALQLTSGADSWAPTTFKLYHKILEIINSLWMNVGPTSRTGIPNIYSGLLTFILIIVYISTGGIKTKTKVLNLSLLVFLLAGINVNYLDYVWHVFHFPNELPHRFAFVFSFLVVTIAYETFITIKEGYLIESVSKESDEDILVYTKPSNYITSKHMMGILAGGVIYLAFAQMLFPDVMDDLTVYLNITFWILYCALIAGYINGKLKQKFVLTIFFIVVVTEGLISALNGVDSVGSSNRTTYRTGMEDTAVLMEEINQSEEGFFRVENTTPFTINSSALYTFKGISQFSSAANSNITKALAGLGLAGNVASNRYTYYLSTPIMNSLLSMKYIINRTGETDSEYLDLFDYSGQTYAYRYKYYLPLGYMVDTEILNWDISSNTNPFEVQNDYIKKAAGIEDSVLVPIEKEYVSNNNLSFNDSGNVYHYTNVDSSKTGYLEVVYTIDRPQSVYLYISANRAIDDKAECEIFGETKTEEVRYPHVSELGYFEAGERIRIKVSVEAASSGNCTIYLYGADTELFETAYATLADEGLNVTSYDDTNIEGTINVKQAGIMYTSIPYEKGWSAKVDGEEVEIIPLNEAFSCLKLEVGEHTVSFHYTPEGYKLGLSMTIIALILFIIITILVQKNFFQKYQNTLKKTYDKNKYGKGKSNKNKSITTSVVASESEAIQDSNEVLESNIKEEK